MVLYQQTYGPFTMEKIWSFTKNCENFDLLFTFEQCSGEDKTVNNRQTIDKRRSEISFDLSAQAG